MSLERIKIHRKDIVAIKKRYGVTAAIDAYFDMIRFPSGFSRYVCEPYGDEHVLHTTELKHVIRYRGGDFVDEIVILAEDKELAEKKFLSILINPIKYLSRHELESDVFILSRICYMQDRVLRHCKAKEVDIVHIIMLDEKGKELGHLPPEKQKKPFYATSRLGAGTVIGLG